MQHLSIFPILIPLLFGAIMLLPPISRDINSQRITSIVGTLFLLISSAALLYQINTEGVQL
ncbi:MAG: monovalent cation/H+ antiporter subunit D, partial [Gammaproteobacteria bacterium]|nr:monovalent cation/H+ antiporter subunit D [Gammaproteobacteria bacterium]